MQYTANAIDKKTHDALVAWCDSKEHMWELAPGNRLVLQYGYSYRYNSRTIGSAANIPKILTDLSADLVERKLLNSLPNQIIINKYEPGQGITPHTDNINYFGDEVASLSLESAVNMDFLFDGKEVMTQRLEPQSLLVLRDEARWKWMHSIACQTYDIVAGAKIPRGRRISITFRTVVKL